MHQVSKKHGTQGDNLLDRRLYRVGGREACGEPPNDVEGLELIRPSFVVTNLCVKLRDCAGEKFLVDVLPRKANCDVAKTFDVRRRKLLRKVDDRNTIVDGENLRNGRQRSCRYDVWFVANLRSVQPGDEVAGVRLVIAIDRAGKHVRAQGGSPLDLLCGKPNFDPYVSTRHLFVHR